MPVRDGCDGSLDEEVVGEDQREGGLDEWHRPWEHARIVSALTFQHRRFSRRGHRVLRRRDGGGGFERRPDIDEFTIGDATLDAA